MPKNTIPNSFDAGPGYRTPVYSHPQQSTKRTTDPINTNFYCHAIHSELLLAINSGLVEGLVSSQKPSKRGPSNLCDSKPCLY